MDKDKKNKNIKKVAVVDKNKTLSAYQTESKSKSIAIESLAPKSKK